MDCSKIGELIRTIRMENQMTQKQLADQMNISDKTISKWERGLGCPDVSLLPELSSILGVNIEELLTGDLNMNDINNGNLKKTRFYVCPDCGNIMTSSGEVAISCCGRKLEALEAVKAEGAHKMVVDTIEGEWYIETEHEMVKEHYISFIAFVTGDKMILVKQYPEWGIHVRIPKFGHGILYTYCTKHGLTYQYI